MSKQVKALEGKKVYLRPMETDDADLLYHSLNNDTEMRRLTGTHKIFSKMEIESSIQRFEGDNSRVGFAIVTQEDDKLVGDVALNEMHDSINRNANFRIAIFDSYTNAGYGTEATKLMLEYGFGILNLHRIELDVYSFNERAAHVYKKMGFKIEGVKRENWYYNHGYYDSVVMSILESEYRELYVK